MIYGSVCSGIEAASVAWHPLGWTPAFFAEIEKFPSRVLAHHFGSNMPGEPPAKNGIPNHGDFTKIGGDAGPVDLLVGGTPCQSFSVAGKRLGLDDPRGNLALEYLSLAQRLGARWIVWENVPGVLSSRSDETEGDGGLRPDLDGRKAGDEWLEESDFATFLQFVRQCGYGFAYRVLDAQFTRASGYERAVPQRRRRVILVGYLGDWRCAAAVLLDAEGLRGNPAPRREKGQRPAPTIASRPTGGGGLGTDFDLDGGLIAADMLAFGEYGPGETASTMKQRDFKDATDLVAHALRGEGFDASEDGTGRGTPMVPIAFNSREDPDVTFDRTGPLGSSSPQAQAIASNWAVRRLTPTECERLQGFPDGWTAIPGAADGPRYKALGNSMAINVMRAVGQRIDMVEKLIQAGKIKPETFQEQAA